jgi:hypothetical protein
MLASRWNILDAAPRLSCAGFNSILKAAQDAGEITFGRETALFFETNTPGEVIVNMSRILGKKSTDPWSLTEAEMEGRRQIWELYEFFRKRVPGFSEARMGFSGPFVGVRSSRQIVGRHRIAVEELFERTRFPDLISHCGYPVDIHSPDGSGTEHRHFEYGARYRVAAATRRPRTRLPRHRFSHGSQAVASNPSAREQSPRGRDLPRGAPHDPQDRHL